MQTREFYIDYFDKEYLDSQHPGRDNKPHFQLAEGEIGGTKYVSEDGDGYRYSVVSSSGNFYQIIFDLLEYLKKPTSLNREYQYKVSKLAEDQLDNLSRGVFTEILNLHNDFVAPLRTI